MWTTKSSVGAARFIRQVIREIRFQKREILMAAQSGFFSQPLEEQSQHFFLTDLYIKKGHSLRRISEELGCSKTTVRKKLVKAEN
jgi:hypothetical protein